MQMGSKKGHFVLVHGLCHGSWAWYKVMPLLEAAGHRVTALDMTGGGINPNSIKKATTFEQYAEPLLKYMKSVEGKVILVGHSVAGSCLALASERFPEKVSVAVFVAAFLPDTTNVPSYVLDKFGEQTSPGYWMDSEFEPYGEETLFLLGKELMEKKIYTASPKQDIELAKNARRQSCMYNVDLSRCKKYTDLAYGSVKKAYIMTKEDVVFPRKFQLWLVQNYPVDLVLEIEGADHVPMFSKPQELCDYLKLIASKYN